MKPRHIVLFLIACLLFFASCNLSGRREHDEFKKALLEGKRMERLKAEFSASATTLAELRTELSVAIMEHTAAKAEMECMKASPARNGYELSKELLKQSVVINNAEEAVFGLQEEIALQRQNLSNLQADIHSAN